MAFVDAVAQSLLTGILIGGFYGMFAMSISMAWGALEIINVAYFPLALLSSYITYSMFSGLGLDPFLSLLVSIPAFFGAGVVLQKFFNKFKIDVFRSLIISFGLFIVVENVMVFVWTGDVRRLSVGYGNLSLQAGTIFVPLGELLAFIAAGILVVLNLIIMKKTKFGIALRATSEDREIAAIYGVNHERLSLVVSGLSISFIAVTGVFISLLYPFTPSYGELFLGTVFAVTILGGLANVTGAFIAGMVVGVAESLTSTLYAPSWAPLVTFALLIIILVVKPSGLVSR